jgi:hypothetical protein
MPKVTAPIAGDGDDNGYAHLRLHFAGAVIELDLRHMDRARAFAERVLELGLVALPKVGGGVRHRHIQTIAIHEAHLGDHAVAALTPVAQDRGALTIQHVGDHQAAPFAVLPLPLKRLDFAQHDRVMRLILLVDHVDEDRINDPLLQFAVDDPEHPILEIFYSLGFFGCSSKPYDACASMQLASCFFYYGQLRGHRLSFLTTDKEIRYFIYRYTNLSQKTTVLNFKALFHYFFRTFLL